MTAKQYGIWDRGKASPGKMLNKLLRSMRNNGVSLPVDSYGAMTFKMKYLYNPPLDPSSPYYESGGLNDTGFSVIKVTYDR